MAITLHHNGTREMHAGHALVVLPRLTPASVQTCITSPPYWQQRDYSLPPLLWPDGWIGQLGLEPTPEQYVEHLVTVFRAVARVLRADGTLWLNLGDTYNAYNANRGASKSMSATADAVRPHHARGLMAPDLQQKALIGIPWRTALALQADGWILRNDIIWRKAAMPERTKDRAQRAHEYLFLFARRPRYYFGELPSSCRSTVWQISARPETDERHAGFPLELVEPCIYAATRPGDRVLDPFAGGGTTLRAAERLGRHGVGVDLAVPDATTLAGMGA